MACVTVALIDAPWRGRCNFGAELGVRVGNVWSGLWWVWPANGLCVGRRDVVPRFCMGVMWEVCGDGDVVLRGQLCVRAVPSRAKVPNFGLGAGRHVPSGPGSQVWMRSGPSWGLILHPLPPKCPLCGRSSEAGWLAQPGKGQ